MMCFEHCVVFLYDFQQNDLLTISDSDVDTRQNEDDPVLDTFIRFPIGIGMTGYCCTNATCLYANDILLESKYNKDIDNVKGLQEVRNIITCEFGTTQGNHHNRSGVVQLINKLSPVPINQNDLQKVQALRGFMGGVVEKISILESKSKITFGLSQETEGITEMINLKEEGRMESKVHYEDFYKKLLKLDERFMVENRPSRQLDEDLEHLDEVSKNKTRISTYLLRTIKEYAYIDNTLLNLKRQ